MTRLSPPLKWHGGKQPLAAKIVALMPPRCKCPNKPAADDPGWLHYVEPYFGGGAVLFANDPEGISEVANDLNGELANFWQVLRDDQKFAELQRWLEATEFNEDLWQWSHTYGKQNPFMQGEKDAVLCAWWFFIRCRQSLAGRMKGFTGVTKTRTRRGMNNEVSAWLTCIEGLPAVHERLKRVLITNRPALEIVRKHDGLQTLFYLDPPYPHGTRSTTGEYAHEMTDDDHQELLKAIKVCRGKVMLSSYPNEMYDDELLPPPFNWRAVDFDMPNNAAGGKSKARECERVYLNY